LATQWIFFMRFLNHSSSGGLMQSFQGSEKMWRRRCYMKQVEVKNWGRFLTSGEKLSSCLLLVRMCGVCLEFHNK